MRIIELQTVGNIAKAGPRIYSEGFLIKGAIRQPGHLSMSVYRCDSKITIRDGEHVGFDGCRLRIEYFRPRYIKDIGSQKKERIIGGHRREDFAFYRTVLGGELYTEKKPICRAYDLMYEGERGNFQIHADFKEKRSFIDEFFGDVLTNNKLTRKDKKYLSDRVLILLSKDIR